jgi:hypothetical protein
VTKKKRRSAYEEYLATHPHSTHDEWVALDIPAAPEPPKAARKWLLGQFLTELRRSHAAGKHGKTRRDRANTKRKAVDQDRKDSQ